MKVATMNVKQQSRLTILFVALALVASAVLLSGCPERIKGTEDANQKPVVYFVNIPPDGYQTSRNPIIYWVGSDPDGQVQQFRYTVVLESDMGGATVQNYIRNTLPSIPKEKWTYLVVQDTGSTPNPQTQSVVKMSASLDDPINEFLGQYVFLQAFDEMGLASDVAYRRFFRNDNPPQTLIGAGPGYDATQSPFINAVNPGGAITGVRIAWGGEDRLDYPSDPPPFQYQWKLLGPYTFGNATREFERFMTKYKKKVFNANNGKVYRFGDGDSVLFYCDSLDTAATPDTVVTYVCDTLYIDTISGPNTFGVIDSMIMVQDEEFENDAEFFKLVDSSKSAAGDGWVSTTADTFFDVYKDAPSDTTCEKKYIFWARCRDDANVPDQVPNFIAVNVIEPKYEREVLVIHFFDVFSTDNAPYWGLVGMLDAVNRPLQDTAFVYWRDALAAWRPANPLLQPRDMIYSGYWNQYITFKTLLQYKIIILYNDDSQTPNFIKSSGLSPQAAQVFKAIDAGVAVWALWRSPGSRNSSPTVPANLVDNPERTPTAYRDYFGIEGLVYSGWRFYADSAQQNQRIEDFVGAYSLMNETGEAADFPDLVVDTALLHRRYDWGGLSWPWDDPATVELRDSLYRYIPSIGALPEVGFATSIYGTEPLYLYKSRYGAIHPLGYNASYEGSPVAVRYGTNLFRTAHFCFTPLAMKADDMQKVINRMLDWLYPENLAVPPNETINRFSNAKVKISADEVARRDVERTEAIKRELGITDETMPVR